jgi:hypothetical protein
MSKRVETIPQDVYSTKFLKNVTQNRGFIMGTLGRLLNVPDLELEKRVHCLQDVCRYLYPYFGKDDEATTLFNAANVELQEHGIEIVTMLEEESERKRKADEEREVRRVRREAERAEAEKRRQKAFERVNDPTPMVESQKPVEPQEKTPEEILAGAAYIKIEECVRRNLHMTEKEDGACAYCGRSKNEGEQVELLMGIQDPTLLDDQIQDAEERLEALEESCNIEQVTVEGKDLKVMFKINRPDESVEDTGPGEGTLDALFGNPGEEPEEETFECYLCEGIFPASDCNDFEGACICNACHEEFVEVE